MKILFEVSSGDAASVLVPLAQACDRNAVTWSCFFTGDGVKTLARDDVLATIAGATKAAAWEVSWERYMGDQSCPVEIGSQTNNSAMVGDADKIVSL
ncbi:MAG: hypothetical protein QNM00_06555 [Gammaproteobacteria bacterium]|nr:hypothetical protein [Gammaproteobacteria bacterium]